MFNIALNPGFYPQSEASYKGTGIGQIPSTNYGISRKSDFVTDSRVNRELKALVGKARAAYRKDGIIRASVDLHAEQFRDFSFRGDPEIVKALEERLNIMSIRTNEFWKDTLRRAINELIQCGTAPIIKLRGGSETEGKRPLYTARPYSIAGLQIIGADRLELVNEPKNKVRGYKLNDCGGPKEKMSVILNGGKKLEPEKALSVSSGVSPASKGILYPGIDICMLTYKRVADTDFGQGITFPGLDDVALLRTIEGNTAIMIKKYSMPLLWHKIIRTTSPMGSQQGDIDKAIMMHQRAAPDGVIVTGANHELKPLGAESQALRVEGYLDFFASRAAVGVGATPAMIGIRDAGLGVAEAAKEKLMSRVRYFQNEIASQIQFSLIWEILWEMGYDPYRNKDHRVFIEFVDIDEDRQIKLQTHAADMFVKGFTDHEQSMKIGKIDSKPVEAQMFPNKYGKKEETTPKPTSKAKKSKEEFRGAVKYFIPTNEKEVSDTIYLLSKLYFIDEVLERKLTRDLELLCHDQEAIIQYLYQELEEQPIDG